MPSCSLAKFNLAEDWSNTILWSAITLHHTVCCACVILNFKFFLNVTCEHPGGPHPESSEEGKAHVLLHPLPQLQRAENILPWCQGNFSYKTILTKNKPENCFFLCLSPWYLLVSVCFGQKSQQCVGEEKQKGRGLKQQSRWAASMSWGQREIQGYSLFKKVTPVSKWSDKGLCRQGIAIECQQRVGIGDLYGNTQAAAGCS